MNFLLLMPKISYHTFTCICVLYLFLSPNTYPSNYNLEYQTDEAGLVGVSLDKDMVT